MRAFGLGPRVVVGLKPRSGFDHLSDKQLETRGFSRISIDEVIWRSADRYGLDYPPEAYGEKVSAARDALKDEVARLLRERRSAVVDPAFWSRAHRQSFATLIALEGGRPRMSTSKQRKKFCKPVWRCGGPGSTRTLPIGDQMLNRFMETFEEPSPDEGALFVAA